jgi:hypothetical protein
MRMLFASIQPQPFLSLSNVETGNAEDNGAELSHAI